MIVLNIFMKSTDKTTNTNYWLKQNGLKPELLTAVDVELLQAQKIAHNLLKHHARLLGMNQAATLNNFLNAMTFGNKRRRITKQQCYKVMNIGTEVNRKVFKQHRLLNK